jgi:hypothetical protein
MMVRVAVLRIVPVVIAALVCVMAEALNDVQAVVLPMRGKGVQAFANQRNAGIRREQPAGEKFAGEEHGAIGFSQACERPIVRAFVWKAKTWL